MDSLIHAFVFERVLSHDPRTKLVYVLGTAHDKPCILSFEKARYADAELPQLAKRTRNLDNVTENNIYGWAMGTVALDTADTLIKVIYPATELHIRKYEQQFKRMVVETPAMYAQATLPYIKSLPAERTQWVTNILEGKSEADRVIYRNDDPETGFVVLPDMKWDGSKESLYLVAIALRNDILSLRSLTRKHLGILRKIRDASYGLAKDKYGLEKDQLRLFVHYQPSYYHFHVHITALSFSDAPGVVVGQAHLLDAVIDNIEVYDDYYQRATLPFTVGETHPLYLAHTAPSLSSS